MKHLITHIFAGGGFLDFSSQWSVFWFVRFYLVFLFNIFSIEKRSHCREKSHHIFQLKLIFLFALGSISKQREWKFEITMELVCIFWTKPEQFNTGWKCDIKDRNNFSRSRNMVPTNSLTLHNLLLSRAVTTVWVSLESTLHCNKINMHCW